MFASKHLLLLCFLPVVYGANPKGCTSRTIKHWRAVTDFFNSFFPYDVMFDCYCAERAEGLAWVTAIGAKTQDYNDYYNIYTSTEVAAEQDQPDAEQMLVNLAEEHPQIKTQVSKGRHYGCAISSAKKMGGNVTHALTCVFKKASGACYH